MQTARLVCPRCEGDIKVEYEVHLGFGPTRIHPPEPATAEIIGEAGRSGCNCELSDADWEYLHIQLDTRVFEGE